jgi:hypothetical protein
MHARPEVYDAVSKAAFGRGCFGCGTKEWLDAVTVENGRTRVWCRECEAKLDQEAPARCH